MARDIAPLSIYRPRSHSTTSPPAAPPPPPPLSLSLPPSSSPPPTPPIFPPPSPPHLKKNSLMSLSNEADAGSGWRAHARTSSKPHAGPYTEPAMHAPLLPSTQEGSTEVRGTSSAQRGRSSGGNSEKASKTTIGLVFTAFCVIRALDRVFNKRVQDRMVNYQLMYINVFWPIGVQLMTIILCMCYVLQQNRAHPGTYDYTFFLPNSKFVSKNGAYPQWRLGLFSFWDELNAVGTSLPGPYISLTLQVR